MGFVLTHMLGNLTLFISPEAYNHYGHGIVSNPLFPLIEVVLFSIFALHILLALSLARKNKEAREVSYAVVTKRVNGSSFASRTMPITGALILVFLVVHLVSFRFAPVTPESFVSYGGVQVRDLYALIMEKFSNPLYTFFYVASMGVLFIHLSHGFSSAFQSLGLNHPKYNPLIKRMGLFYALAVSGGFAAQAIFAYLKGGVQ